MSAEEAYGIAQQIRSRLYTLSEVCLQDSYLDEARYIGREWGAFYLNQSEPFRWAIAKDFAQEFPRHSYSEWAHVFGISRDHPIVRFQLHPSIVNKHRRQYCRRQRYVILAGMVACFGLAAVLPPNLAGAVMIATVFVGLHKISSTL